MPATFWTEERVEILKSRRAAAWSAGMIARLLGCTRNAVIGKADRLGLGRKRVARLPFAPCILPPREGEPRSRRIAFAELEAGECGWISGDDGRCCGHATVRMLARGRVVASPYCGFHSARAYRVPRVD